MFYGSRGLENRNKMAEKNLFLLHENISKLEVKLKSYNCWSFPPGVKIIFIGNNTL